MNRYPSAPQRAGSSSVVPRPIPSRVPVAPVLLAFPWLSFPPFVLLFLVIWCLASSAHVSSRSATQKLRRAWARAAVSAEAVSGIVEDEVILLALVLTVSLSEGVILPEVRALLPCRNTQIVDKNWGSCRATEDWSLSSDLKCCIMFPCL